MASNKPYREKKLGYNISNEDVEKIIKKKLNIKPKGKPVKFTWQGFKNMWVGLMGDPLQNPFSGEMPAKMKRLQELEERNAKEKDYIDFFEEIELSTNKGLQNLAYSLGDIVTTGIDLGAKAFGKETELTEKLTENYEKHKLRDPETLLGKINEVLTQYSIPASSGFKIMNRVRRLSGIQKLK